MTAPVLSVADLSFRYGPKYPEIFHGLTWEFTPGCLTALTGNSGTGKSTLLYLLALMLAPSRGEIRLDGEAVSALPDAQRSAIRNRRMGFVFQNSELDNHRTILESVMEPCLYLRHEVRASGTSSGDDSEFAASADDYERTARDLLTRFELGDLADRRPTAISGGQAQRAALCRALLLHPDIVLADEPTGNLDATNSDLVLDALGEAAAAGHTVIIATHDPRVVDRCDQVVRL